MCYPNVKRNAALPMEMGQVGMGNALTMPTGRKKSTNMGDPSNWPAASPMPNVDGGGVDDMTGFSQRGFWDLPDMFNPDWASQRNTNEFPVGGFPFYSRSLLS